MTSLLLFWAFPVTSEVNEVDVHTPHLYHSVADVYEIPVQSCVYSFSQLHYPLFLTIFNVEIKITGHI